MTEIDTARALLEEALDHLNPLEQWLTGDEIEYTTESYADACARVVSYKVCSIGALALAKLGGAQIVKGGQTVRYEWVRDDQIVKKAAFYLRKAIEKLHPAWYYVALETIADSAQLSLRRSCALSWVSESDHPELGGEDALWRRWIETERPDNIIADFNDRGTYELLEPFDQTAYDKMDSPQKAAYLQQRQHTSHQLVVEVFHTAIKMAVADES